MTPGTAPAIIQSHEIMTPLLLQASKLQTAAPCHSQVLTNRYQVIMPNRFHSSSNLLVPRTNVFGPCRRLTIVQDLDRHAIPKVKVQNTSNGYSHPNWTNLKITNEKCRHIMHPDPWSLASGVAVLTLRQVKAPLRPFLECRRFIVHPT